MSGFDTEWLGELSTSDVALLEEAPGGALSEAGRQAAIEASLSLLGVYFAGGDQKLVDRPAISRSADNRDLDVLQAGLRLRVAIAAGRRLANLLDTIVKRPTFRYELRSVEQVGSLSGALDVNRWVTRVQGDQELSFPVLEVQRGLYTPENVLAVYAVTWLLSELRVSLSASLATADAVEYQAVRHLQDRLTHSKQLPALAACVRTAMAIRTTSAAQNLVNQVKRRLRRREIFNARPYRELANWIDACLSDRPAVAPGDIDLTVYGDRFDTKLFELWCLGTLGRALAAVLRLPEPSVHPAWRRTAAAYRLDAFSGRIELYFQRGLRTVDERHAARWMKENGVRLGGIPDIVVRAQPTIGDSRFAVIDPKLKQRERLPAEELYKILGYLQNFDVTPPVGMVLIYTTNTETVVPNVFHDDRGGTLISIALNPAAPASITATALHVVIRTILGLIDYDAPVRSSEETAPTEIETDDERAERVIHDVAASVQAWGRAHLGEIAPSRERIETLIGDVRWRSLDDDVQVMMATADLVGHQLDPVADFSGPVIGMCTAVEHLLYASLVSPVVGSDSARQRQTRTFGASLDAIEQACRSGGSQLHHDIRAHMATSGIDVDEVLRLMESWRRLNVSYRIPAAHRQVLNKTNWQQLYRMLMGLENLFIRTFDVLQLS